MTDNEIVKALECCSNEPTLNCRNCPYERACNMGKSDMQRDALDLINRQKAEIERYEETVGKLAIKDGEVVGLIDGKKTAYIEKAVAETLRIMAVKTAKVNAIKEFAERLKDNVTYHEDECGEFVPWVDCRDVNNLVKKMTEETT